jgi:ferrous iron transport protein B
LEQDPDFEASAAVHAPEILSKAAALRRTLERTHGKPADAVIAGERHALSMSIAESVCVMEKPTVQLRDRLDGLLMHNVWGYVFLFAFMFLMFQGVFRIGAWLEKPLLALFDDLSGASFLHGSGESPWTVLARGALLGIGGGIAVVVPYLVPFLFGLAFFEDLGYLPRVAFLLDAFMHRIGLHGTAVIPAVMGYGCNVPAVMATRILDSPRDRFIATMVAAFVPCSARTTVVFGLVGATIGATAALSLYGLNLAVVALAGAGMARLLPESAPGMILEIPPYRLPNLRSIAAKVWLRLKDFVVFAWPLLIFGSAVLGLIDFLGWSPSINHVLSPLTGLLGLPSVLGVPLVFGVLRKELSMLMLFQAIGTNHPEAVLSALQLFVYTLFVVFYIPCLGTIGVLVRQVGFRRAGILAAASIVTALCLCAATRLIAAWLF